MAQRKKKDKAKEAGKIDMFRLAFGEEFMHQHADQIITDHNLAIVELIANTWDAGV
ncbi:MAG: hypothetical protein HYZ14_17175 [Bacteroidetes bacterium]|nr:hypothetical protein [Bacteroidota bacterium]